MKFIVIVLMPGKADDARFMLKKILSCSYEECTKFQNSDKHFLYQVQTVDSLNTAKDILQIFNIQSEWQFIMDANNNLLVTELNHVVIEVSDDFNLKQSLSDQAIRVHILKPEEYVSSDTLTEEIKALEDQLDNGKSKSCNHTKSMFAKAPLADERKKLKQKLGELKAKQKLLDECPFVAYKNSNSKVEADLDDVPRLLLRNNAEPDLQAFFDEYISEDDSDTNANNSERFTR